MAAFDFMKKKKESEDLLKTSRLVNNSYETKEDEGEIEEVGRNLEGMPSNPNVVPSSQIKPFDLTEKDPFKVEKDANSEIEEIKTQLLGLVKRLENLKEKIK